LEDKNRLLYFYVKHALAEASAGVKVNNLD
jgi:hypothetical protein